MRKLRRVAIEVIFIVFLFYVNLLMGEFERSGAGRSKGLAWAILNIFTLENIIIAVIAATIGHILFESLRKSFSSAEDKD